MDSQLDGIQEAADAIRRGREREESGEEIVVTPYWPNMIRWHANALMTHSFDFGARGPLGSFMQMVGHLAQTDAAELNRIIAEFEELRVEDDSAGDPS